MNLEVTTAALKVMRDPRARRQLLEALCEGRDGAIIEVQGERYEVSYLSKGMVIR